VLYALLHSLADDFKIFNVVKYLSFRSGLAAVTALLFVIIAGNPFIEWMKLRQFGQAIRTDGPQSHLKKIGTPTMGGLLIIAGALLGILLWSDLTNPYIWALVFLLVVYGLVGFLDDYIKIIKKDPEGLASRWKFRLLFLGAGIASFLIYTAGDGQPMQGELFFPFFKNFSLDMGAYYMLLSVFVIVGTSNAVNLTDGLDGLAIGPCIVNAAAFFILCYLGGNAVFARYLQIPHVMGLGEVAIVCAALLGAGVAFLWFNTFPAQIFMGDVGALSLGGGIGALAVLSKNELLLIILGGVFVMETLSVILQVLSFKLTGKRIFRMAPIHHHFELMGWPEPKVIVRFWILSFILAIAALGTLKLR
jgi:phospho-N-acetylmuramoyl-pentapeptide-transferase